MQLPYNSPKQSFLSQIGQFLQTGSFSKKSPVAVSQNDMAKIIQIVNEFKDNSRKELQDWQDALNQANDIDNPRWNALHDLYDKLEPDAQLGISKEIRVAATLSKPFIIYDKKTGKEIPEKTALLKDKEWFFNFVWNFIETVFKGYTCAYLYDSEQMKFQYLPHRNIVPQKDFLLTDVGNNKGISLEDKSIANRIIFVKYKLKYGILNDIVPNLIWKRNARQAWAEFAEKFGIPPIWATSTKSDKKTLDLIEAMLKQLGEAATAVLPAGTTITVQDQATKGDPYNVYLKQIELDDQQIAKRLLGGTMITDSGSSYNQAQVHERTLNDIISLFDKMLITFVVNDKLLPMMASFGFPFNENDGFKFDVKEQLSLTQLGDLVTKFSNAFDVEEEWVTNTFGIPVKKKADATANPNFKQATTAMAAALVAKGVTLPKYVTSCCKKHFDISADFTENLLADLADELINNIWKGESTLINEVLRSIKAHNKLLDGLFEGWGERRLQLSYDAPDNHCLAAMEYNLFEFSRLKEKSNVFALNQLLIDKEKNNIVSFNDFKAAATKYLNNPDVNHLRTEYNHAVAVGQNARAWHQYKSEEDTITVWVQWQTVGDAQVRPEHVVLNGKVFNLKDNNLTCFPPKDWGCRCEMIQYLGKPTPAMIMTNDAALKLLGIEKGSKWDVNRGVIEQVFTSNEMYMKQQSLVAETNQLTYESYGNKAYDDIKGNYKPLKLDNTITPANVKELFKKELNSNYMGFKDYYDRNIVLKEKVFTEHTTLSKYTSKDELRHQLFPFIKDVLNNADEVYMFQRENGKFQTNYIKFYNNKAIVVNTELGKQNLEIKTWFEMKAEDDVRRGYLIKTKMPQ